MFGRKEKDWKDLDEKFLDDEEFERMASRYKMTHPINILITIASTCTLLAVIATLFY